VRQVGITQSSRAVFQIRLEMKDGVAVFEMADTGYLSQTLRQNIGFATNHLHQALVMQTAEQPVISGEEAAIEERDSELDIVLVEARAVVKGTRRRAHPQSNVPHLLTHGAHWILDANAERFGFTEEKDINVRIREQGLAPEATQRYQSIPGRRRGRDMSIPEPQRELVDQGRTLTDYRLSRSGCFEVLPNAVEFLAITIAQSRLGRRTAHTCSLPSASP